MSTVSDLRIPDFVAELYSAAGPFATAYLDASRDKEQGAREVELRWQQLRSQLAEQGADEVTLAAMDPALGAHADAPGRRGRLIVAANGELRCDEPTPRPPVRPLARWSPLPHLVPFLAQRGPQIAHVIVIADRTGADIITVDAQRAAAGAPGEVEAVEGSVSFPIHRTSTADWSERHFQLRVENSWEANARDVAEATVTHAISVRAALVLLVGDERARGLLREDLAAQLPSHVEIVETAAGGRGDGSSAEALDEAVHDALLQHSWRRRREVLDHLRQNVGRRAFAVTGVADVVHAAQRSQIDTLVLSDDPSSTLHAWIGPDARQIGLDSQALLDMGVPAPVEERFDAALLRALAGSGAQLLITPNAHDYVRDGIGALLRYDDAATPQS